MFIMHWWKATSDKTTSYINKDAKHGKSSWVFKCRRQVGMCGFDVDYVHLRRNHTDKRYKKRKVNIIA